MKVAIVHPTPLVPGTIDLQAYALRFEELGHESLFVTSKYLRSPGRVPVVELSIEQMANPAVWRDLGIDIAVTFVWFQYPEITEALAAAGCRVVSRADTDGQQSIRVFPGKFLRCMVGAANAGRKFVEFKSYLHRYAVRYRSEDQWVIRTIDASRCVAMETSKAAKNLRRVLNYYGRSDLARKLVVIPHCVDDAFLRPSVAVERSPTVISIGRWTAPQKNPQLLLGVIRRHLQRSDDTRFVVIGPGATALCGDLSRQTGRVDCHEQVPLVDMPRYLADARILLSSSRWEGSPISANEALACGCSVVGTPIPGFFEIADAGPFGTVSKGHGVRSLHQALKNELHAWESGRRDSGKIAEFWRPRLSQRRVMQQILAAANLCEEPSVVSPSIETLCQTQIN
jgi:glycosyltransferase involved in cell wall biosynthesis